jgi:hypothetical protein
MKALFTLIIIGHLAAMFGIYNSLNNAVIHLEQRTYIEELK